MGWKDMYYIHLAEQGLLEGFCEHGNGPPISLNAGIFD
jgi:hypothetical protein